MEITQEMIDWTRENQSLTDITVAFEVKFNLASIREAIRCLDLVEDIIYDNDHMSFRDNEKHYSYANER